VASHDAYISRSVPSSAGHRFSNRRLVGVRALESLDALLRFRHVSAVVKEFRASGAGRRTARDLVEEILRRRDSTPIEEAIRRAIASTKPSSSASGRARLTYHIVRGVAVEVRSRRERSRARGTADQMWEAFRAAAAGCSPTPTSGWPSRVFSRDRSACRSETNSCSHRGRSSDLRDADHREFGETDDVPSGRQAGRPHSCGDVPRLAGQIEVARYNSVRTFEYYDTQARAGVHSSEQIRRPSRCGVYMLKGG